MVDTRQHYFVHIPLLLLSLEHVNTKRSEDMSLLYASSSARFDKFTSAGLSSEAMAHLEGASCVST